RRREGVGEGRQTHSLSGRRGAARRSRGRGAGDPPDCEWSPQVACLSSGVMLQRLAIPLMLSRRELLKTAAAAFAGAGYLTSTGLSLAHPPVVDLWAEAENIVRRVVAPAFPDRTFDITRYGATRDRGDATGAFRTAIDTCYAAGGGRVVVPAGRFVAGA